MVRYVIGRDGAKTRSRCYINTSTTGGECDYTIDESDYTGQRPQQHLPQHPSSSASSNSKNSNSLSKSRSSKMSASATNPRNSHSQQPLPPLHHEKETHVPSPTTPIDLLRGHPTTHLLATIPILTSTTALLSDPSSLPQNSYDIIRHPLAYGPDFGNWDIRKEIIAWQEELYGSAAADEVVVTPRASPPGTPSRRGSEVVSGGINEESERMRKEQEKAWGVERVDPTGFGINEPKGYGDPSREARITLTCGASYGMMNALVQCTSPGTGYTRRAFIISPVYFLACAMFTDAGFGDKLTPLAYPPPEGTTLPELLLAELKADQPRQPYPHVSLEGGLKPVGGRGGVKRERKIYKYVLYCVPTYGNPTGQTWDFETRRRIVEIAREWDILIICDDVYDFLGWPVASSSPPASPIDGIPSTSTSTHHHRPTPPPRLVTLDRQLVLAHSSSPDNDAGNVISNCSFSKLLGPGLRCGWQESATPVLARQLAEGGANHSSGNPSHFVSCVVYELLKPQPEPAFDDEHEGAVSAHKQKGKRTNRKINEIIDNVAAVLGYRAERFVEACYKYLPKGSEVLGFPPPDASTDAPVSVAGGGGYFLWMGIGPSSPPEKVIDARQVLLLAKQGEPSSSSSKDQQEFINRISIGSGDIFECPGTNPSTGSPNQVGYGKRWVRISVSWCPAGVGVEGIKRLARAIERWQEGERVEGGK